MKQIIEKLWVAEEPPEVLPERFGAAFLLDDRDVARSGDRPLIVRWAILPSPGPNDANAWLSQVGFLCEILHSALGRGMDILLVGVSSANLAAAYLVRNHGLMAAQVIPSVRDLANFREDGLLLIESSIPGRRLVHAPTVQPPQHVAPRGTPPQPASPAGFPTQVPMMAGSFGLGAMPLSQAPLTAGASATPASAGGIPPAPLPQSGMAISPIVGGGAGGPVSRTSTEQDRRIDAVLGMLPGHRPQLVGQEGERPTPPPADQLVSVMDLAAKQQSSGGQDRTISASDGAVARHQLSPGEGS